MTEPASLLDRAVTHAQAGTLTMQTVLWTLASGNLYVPSGADPGEDRSGFRPVYYPKDGSQMLAAFSTVEGAGVLGDLAPYVVVFSGAELVTMMPPQHGLVVNPGQPLGFDIAPDGLAAFRQEITT